MSTRSVSFGNVEEQVFEADDANDYYQDDDEEVGRKQDDEEVDVVGETVDEDEQEGTIGGKDATSSKGNAAVTSNSNQQHQHQNQSRQQLMCPNCGGHDIEAHDASGASVCTSCGVVVEENAIVSSVEFVENSGGSSSMVGQFVSATSSKAYTGGGGGGGGHGNMRGGRYGFSKDSRETTLANGRRRIQDVASRLRLGSHYVDAAHRLFTVAVEKNFVQGRRTTHVVAACLYIACRQEKSQHMLIDFSDALQVNVYTLGTTFLKFRRLLGLKLEIIDPALYVYRFAAHLDLDKKANAVALTALRLVGRMKRDWIVAGRRPAGICAAALLIAARAHGFSKQHQDVTRILRVCGLTVNNRVREFEQTPSANLTLTQFNQVELDKEADPPCFTMNRILEARAKAIQENNVDLLTSGLLDDPMGGKRASRWRDSERKLTSKKKEFQALYDSIEKELQEGQEQPLLLENGNDNRSNSEDADVITGGNVTTDKEADGDGDGEETSKGDTEEEEGASTSDRHFDDTSSKNDTTTPDKSNANGGGKPAAKNLEEQGQHQLVLRDNLQVVVANKALADAYPRSTLGRALILPDHATTEEMLPAVTPVEAKLKMSDWKACLPDTIEDEIDSMFRSEEEIAQKEVIFNKINKDYLDIQDRKENERLNSEATAKDKEQDDAAQQDGHLRYLNSNRGRKRKKDGAGVEGDEELTTEEQLLAAVSNRKISRKINYDAMRSIFDDAGTFATDSTQTTDRESELFGDTIIE